MWTGQTSLSPRSSPSSLHSVDAKCHLIAASDIPVDTFSVDVEVQELAKQPLGEVLVRLSSSGRVEAIPGPGSHSWVRAACLAGDCHAGNVRLQRGRRRGCVMVRTVRAVSVGDELKLWFSEELLAALRIPSFLAPANIQGDQRYVCHRCSALFELPNPLKLHLALDCGRAGGEDALWSRLLSSMTSSGEPALGTFPIQVPAPNVTSAFSPWLRAPTILPRLPAPPPVTPTDIAVHHARMESLVSSLGRSKKGHLCLYCGKLYSRKYGLKIHIRTHTGYKPLSCKFCLRPFGDPSNLNKHVRLHAEGDTPYRCEECGKVLVRRRDLERHLKARHHITLPQTVCDNESS